MGLNNMAMAQNKAAVSTNSTPTILNPLSPTGAAGAKYV
jgi:hypothetical protein